MFSVFSLFPSLVVQTKNKSTQYELRKGVKSLMENNVQIILPKFQSIILKYRSTTLLGSTSVQSTQNTNQSTKYKCTSSIM
jgi:hypothetical protein